VDDHDRGGDRDYGCDGGDRGHDRVRDGDDRGHGYVRDGGDHDCVDPKFLLLRFRNRMFRT